MTDVEAYWKLEETGVSYAKSGTQNIAPDHSAVVMSISNNSGTQDIAVDHSATNTTTYTDSKEQSLGLKQMGKQTEFISGLEYLRAYNADCTAKKGVYTPSTDTLDLTTFTTTDYNDDELDTIGRSENVDVEQYTESKAYGGHQYKVKPARYVWANVDNITATFMLSSVSRTIQYTLRYGIYNHTTGAWERVEYHRARTDIGTIKLSIIRDSTVYTLDDYVDGSGYIYFCIHTQGIHVSLIDSFKVVLQYGPPVYSIAKTHTLSVKHIGQSTKQGLWDLNEEAASAVWSEITVADAGFWNRIADKTGTIWSK